MEMESVVLEAVGVCVRHACVRACACVCMCVSVFTKPGSLGWPSWEKDTLSSSQMVLGFRNVDVTTAGVLLSEEPLGGVGWGRVRCVGSAVSETPTRVCSRWSGGASCQQAP